MQHTGIQYTVKILGNQGMSVMNSILFLIFNICFFKSILFAEPMTQKLFKLAQKNQGVELKQIIFFSSDKRALKCYCLKAGKTIVRMDGRCMVLRYSNALFTWIKIKLLWWILIKEARKRIFGTSVERKLWNLYRHFDLCVLY